MTQRRFLLRIPAAVILGTIVSFGFHRYFDPALSSPPLGGAPSAAPVAERVTPPQLVKHQAPAAQPRSEHRRAKHHRQVKHAVVAPRSEPVSAPARKPAATAPVASKPTTERPASSAPAPSPAPTPAPVAPKRSAPSTAPAAAPKQKNSFYDSG